MMINEKEMGEQTAAGACPAGSVRTKVRAFFSTKISADCAATPEAPYFGQDEDIMLGYEAGWPSTSDPLQ